VRRARSQGCIIRILLNRVEAKLAQNPVHSSSRHARDPTHHSTPPGWTAFGPVHRRAKDADYPGVVDRLVAVGADITAVGNGEGRTLVDIAKGNAEMPDTLRRHGAR
jgi:hypothetical protein